MTRLIQIETGFCVFSALFFAVLSGCSSSSTQPDTSVSDSSLVQDVARVPDVSSDHSSNPPSSGNGGGTGAGGATGSGGVAASSRTATGGTNSMGGISETGGVQGTGGAPATGGATAPGSSGGATGVSFPPTCPTHTPLSCPAIDSTKTFGSLSQSEVSALCDCEFVAYGGYGTSQTCTCADGSMATNTNPASKAACIAAYRATPACTWVMSDYFKCMNLMQDPCNMMGMAISLGDPSCAGGMKNPGCAGQ